jgi:hypothetical protein
MSISPSLLAESEPTLVRGFPRPRPHRLCRTAGLDLGVGSENRLSIWQQRRLRGRTIAHALERPRARFAVAPWDFQRPERRSKAPAMAKRLKRRVVQICQAAHKRADAMLEIAGPGQASRRGAADGRPCAPGRLQRPQDVAQGVPRGGPVIKPPDRRVISLANPFVVLGERPAHAFISGTEGESCASRRRGRSME